MSEDYEDVFAAICTVNQIKKQGKSSKEVTVMLCTEIAALRKEKRGLLKRLQHAEQIIAKLKSDEYLFHNKNKPTTIQVLEYKNKRQDSINSIESSNTSLSSKGSRENTGGHRPFNIKVKTVQSKPMLTSPQGSEQYCMPNKTKTKIYDAETQTTPIQCLSVHCQTDLNDINRISSFKKDTTKDNFVSKAFRRRHSQQRMINPSSNFGKDKTDKSRTKSNPETCVVFPSIATRSIATEEKTYVFLTDKRLLSEV